MLSAVCRVCICLGLVLALSEEGKAQQSNAAPAQRDCFAVMTTGYILIAVQFEERDLVKDHPEYAVYRRQVPMLVPRITRPVQNLATDNLRGVTHGRAVASR